MGTCDVEIPGARPLQGASREAVLGQPFTAGNNDKLAINLL